MIVTDGSVKISKMADNIAGALGKKKILIKDASDFAGTDLLPADIVFLGCEKPSPPSFKYLHELFQHINLAGRSCGIFSSAAETVQYLTDMVRSSEISLNPVTLSDKNSSSIGEWTAKTVSGRY